MKESIKLKLENLMERYEEIGALLGDPKIISDQNKFRSLSKEYAQLEPIVLTFSKYKTALVDIISAKEMLKDLDLEIQEMAEEDLSSAKEILDTSICDLEILLLPRDPNDESDIFLEVRAGTGGDEAAIFAGDLFRMYSRYAETCGWKIEVVNISDGDHGGYKEIISKVSGENVYSQLKFESGAHRVQRVPATESQGRVHTSACTVVVMPVAEEVEGIEINTSDLKIDTFRASGAGGQHVNKTDSAIRITHIPSGVVVECQQERSQHKNKASAISMLKSRLFQAEKEKQHAEQSTTRKNLVGSGDRSERIRTYNYPQGRITDHRINLTLYRLDDIMQGDLGCIIKPLTQEHQASLLAKIGDES